MPESDDEAVNQATPAASSIAATHAREVVALAETGLSQPVADSQGDQAAGPCPSEDELVQLVEGALGESEIAAIEQHIDLCDDCAAVIAGLGAAGAPPKPRQVGRYLLDRRIGGGGMGEVWAAWDPKLRREIAVKLVRPDRADDGRERERLLREARSLARLTHPNVIAVHDVGEAGAEVFIATELVAGDTLASRGGVNADWRVVVRPYAQAARGLAAAHAVGLVHRDVKPANLLVGADGRVRVADFGLAIRGATPSALAPTETPEMPAGPQVTQAGAIAGTPAYMAPEQRTGSAVDAPADQFALCVALGEAVAGRRPPAFVDRAKLIAFVEERRPRERELDELCGILARGLSIEPTDRFPDMTELADELDALVPPTVTSRAHVAARPATAASANHAPLQATQQLRSRGPIVLAIAVAGAAIAIAVTIVVVRGSGAPATPPTPSTAPTSPTAPNLTPAPDLGPSITPAATAPGMAPPASTMSTPTAPPRSSEPLPKARIARPGVSPPTVAPTPPTSPPSQPPTAGVTTREVHEAIQRRDGRGCRALLAQLTTPPPSDFRVASLHALCEMVAGNCAGGLAEQRALNRREGSPESSADILVDLYCPLTQDPDTRLRRISKQLSMQSTFDCDYYLAPTRASAKVAATDRDRHVVGSLLSRVAVCFSHRGDCDLARKVLAEAQVFIPALALNELNARCR